MDVLKPLRVFLDNSPASRFAQVDEILRHTKRAISFQFVEEERGRYCVPLFCGHGDVALWISGCRTINFDVAQLWRQARAGELCAVYVPKAERDSPCPSMMLFRNKYCERLTPAYIFNATPDQLIPSVWAGGSENVGTLEV